MERAQGLQEEAVLVAEPKLVQRKMDLLFSYDAFPNENENNKLEKTPRNIL